MTKPNLLSYYKRIPIPHSWCNKQKANVPLSDPQTHYVTWLHTFTYKN